MDRPKKWRDHWMEQLYVFLANEELTGLPALLSLEAALAVFSLCALTGWWMDNYLPDVSG